MSHIRHSEPPEPAHSVEGSEESGCAQNLAQMIVTGPRSGLPLLFLCGESRRAELPHHLQSNGVLFVELAVYATKQHEHLGLGVEALQRLDSLVFFSPAGARTVLTLLQGHALARVKVYSIGPTTAAELTKLGVAVTGVAKQPTPAALVEVLRETRMTQ